MASLMNLQTHHRILVNKQLKYQVKKLDRPPDTPVFPDFEVSIDERDSNDISVLSTRLGRNLFEQDLYLAAD